MPLAPSNRAETLMALAQQAYAAGKTAEDWLKGLAESAVRSLPNTPVALAPGGQLPGKGTGPGPGPASRSGVPIMNQAGAMLQQAGTQLLVPADYLRSLARQATTGALATVEVELAELFRALRTWGQMTAEALITLVIRLAGVVGVAIREFVFRVSRAAMVVFSLRHQQMGLILARVGLVVVVVSVVVVVLVLLALFGAIGVTLGACVLTVLVVCSIAMATLTIVQNLGAILSVIPFPGSAAAGDALTDWYAENSWFGALCTVLCVILAIPSALVETIVSVGLLGGLNLARIARTLWRSGVDTELIGAKLVAGWLAVKTRCSQDVKALAQALKSVLAWTAERVGAVLAAAGVGANDVWDAIIAAFTATKNQMATIFRSAGADANATAEKLKNAMGATADDAAAALRAAGFSASDAARALKDKFGKAVGAVVQALKRAGWGTNDAVGAAADAFGMARAAVEAAVGAAG